MTATSGGQWWQAFWATIRRGEHANPLREAALAQDLKAWTTGLSSAVVVSCEALGWSAVSKGHKSSLLPKAGQEYLSIDVMGFAKQELASGPVWPFPTAVFELENVQKATRVAYSFWKVLCVRAPLRVVFAYRPDWEKMTALMDEIKTDLVGTMRPEDRAGIKGETLLVAGSRGQGETFPNAYFKVWRLNLNTGGFEKLQT